MSVNLATLQDIVAERDWARLAQCQRELWAERMRLLSQVKGHLNAMCDGNFNCLDSRRYRDIFDEYRRCAARCRLVDSMMLAAAVFPSDDER